MNTDRELLELAAKAAGCDAYEDQPDVPRGLWVKREGRTFVWMPLIDDGDALRLAVKLRIDIGLSGVITGDNGWGTGVVVAKYKDPAVLRRTRVLASVHVQYVPEEMFVSTEYLDSRMAIYYMDLGNYIRGVEAATRRAIVRAAAEIGRGMK